MLDFILRYSLSFFLMAHLSAQGGGNALDFDGSDDYVELSFNMNNLTQFSIEGWVKTTTYQGGRISFFGAPYLIRFGRKDNDVWAYAEQTYQSASVGVTSIASSTSDFTGKWYHFAVVCNTSSIKIYVNGNLEANQSISISGFGTDGNGYNAHIGGRIMNHPPTGYLAGIIDDVRFWNDVRTETEIKENMHKELTGNETDLRAYYKMSNGTGTSLTDNSTNSNTGTLTNMANADWVTSYAVIGDLGSSYKTDVEGIWSVSGTSESDASNGLTMTVGNALTAGNFAVFGNNNTSATSTSDLGSVASTVRTGRIWQVDESGTVSANIKIDMSDATGNYSTSSSASDYKLLYRSGTSGAFSDAATGSSISGDVVTFNSVSLQDGYYALGSTVDNSLPVELTSFELLETRNDGITLQWVTESEINNLGFNLDRKTPITDWSQIASYVTHPALQGQGSVSHQTIYTFTDNTVQENESYDYRLSDVDYDGNVEYHSLQLMGVASSNIPEQFVLYPNYPNPFNPITTIRYDLSKESFVDITIYDMLGNVVNNLVNANESPGYKSIQWNATNNQGKPVSAGVYLYKIQAGDFVDTKKMILLK